MTAQTTVTIAAVYVDGTPLANHRVKVQLIHGGAGGTVDGNLIADRSTVRLDAAGEGSIDLYPNAAISPANTYYSFTVDNSSPTIVRLVSVPASGPVSWTDAGVLLEDPSPPTVVPAPDSGVAGQVLGVVDPGDGPRYDLIDQTGGGAVDSVNGQTGVVVLDATDVGAPTGSGTSTGTNTGDQDLSALAPKASPTFTGTVSGITAAMVGAPSGSGTSTGTNTGDQTLPTLSSLGAVPTSRTLAGLDLTADRTMSALRAALGIEPWVVTCPGATPTLLATVANYAFAMRCYGAGTISKIALQIGTSSGNICVGVYSSTGVAYNAVPDARLATSGSVACPSTGWQEVALGASVDVKTGDWLVVAFDNSTATVFGVASPSSGLANHGLSRAQSSAFPLPSTFTPAASGDRQVRLWGIP